MFSCFPLPSLPQDLEVLLRDFRISTKQPTSYPGLRFHFYEAGPQFAHHSLTQLTSPSAQSPAAPSSSMNTVTHACLVAAARSGLSPGVGPHMDLSASGMQGVGLVGFGVYIFLKSSKKLFPLPYGGLPSPYMDGCGYQHP